MYGDFHYQAAFTRAPSRDGGGGGIETLYDNKERHRGHRDMPHILSFLYLTAPRVGGRSWAIRLHRAQHSGQLFQGVILRVTSESVL